MTILGSPSLILFAYFLIDDKETEKERYYKPEPTTSEQNQYSSNRGPNYVDGTNPYTLHARLETCLLLAKIGITISVCNICLWGLEWVCAANACHLSLLQSLKLASDMGEFEKEYANEY